MPSFALSTALTSFQTSYRCHQTSVIRLSKQTRQEILFALKHFVARAINE